MLRAHVPRQVRVRPSIQISSTRVPARAFLIVAGLIFLGGLMTVAGADLMQTVRLTGALIILALVLFELRCWGRSVPQVARILIRHYRRARQVRLDPVSVMVPMEAGTDTVTRRPRWQVD
jgi:hypothetical protein